MPRSNVPYSREGIESLATALNIDVAYLWVNPINNEFGFRDEGAVGLEEKEQDS